MLRITAIGSGAVEYLLRGSGCREHEHRHQAPVAGSSAEATAGQVGPGYYTAAVEHGEAPGRWAGSGMEAMGLSFRAGDEVVPDDVRAVFGQLRRPESAEAEPEFLGRRPAHFRTEAERYNALVAKESGAVTPERERELRAEAATSGRKPVAYYDFTFSAVKSISVYEAALRVTGQTELADKVVEAHNRAVQVALDYAESRVIFTRTGSHARTVTGNESIGRHEAGTGAVWTVWAHSTSRENEPQMHTHAALLNRTVTESGKIGALDGASFRAYKEVIAAAYERAAEQFVTEETGARFELRPDGKAREIVGVDPEVMAEASTRRGQVTGLVAERVEVYRERHGKEPDAAAMKRITDMAVYETRKAKGPESGPDAVARWSEQRTERLAAMVADVEAAGQQAAGPVSAGGHVSGGAVAADRLAGHGVAAGADTAADVAAAHLRDVSASAIEDVQASYSVWTLGNLAAAIDKRLGSAADLGVAAEDRPARLEEIAREALRAVEVVQVSTPDPVEVPESFRRADGGSIYRRANAERYATAAHLAAEQRVSARMAAPLAGAVTADSDGLDVEALRSRLAAAGLSGDQVDAVAGIIGSGRLGDCLVGPAGTGKSRTVGELARVWAEHADGRVLGLATSQIATQNLAGDGLEALNTTRFLNGFTPDEAGEVRDRLTGRDLVIVDEAGMSSTQELDRIVELCSAAGAKVVLTGDHHQLDAVGAGGLFRQVIAERGAYELREVHRFRSEWEREASLQLRAGDPAAFDAYNDRGRVHAGTWEEMQALAAERYLSDVLDGKDTLLITGTNEGAGELSASIRDRLIELGRVEEAPVAYVRGAKGKQEVSIGDRVQARLNDYRARVDRGPGATVEPDPVTNRALYTVVGRHAESGALLVRDQGGATAHLLPGYVREHVTLAYAVTEHASQGVTVQRGHYLPDRDATREGAYPGLTRGAEENHVYLPAVRAADEHDPERVEESARECFTSIYTASSAQRSATDTLREGQRNAGSFAMAAATLDAVSDDHARGRYGAVLAEVLGPDVAAAAADDRAAYGRLLQATREAEIAGHDPAAVLAEAVGVRGLDTAESVPDVVRWRVRQLTEARVPERAVDPADWTTRVPAPDGTEAGQYVADLAAAATERQTRLGRQLAEEPTGWALSQLGDVPEVGQVAERAAWERSAGAVAAYREMERVPADQESIGAAPSREFPLRRALWQSARDALGPVPDYVVDHRALTDGELYQRTERWAREQAVAPEFVADKMREAYRAAHEQRVRVSARTAEIGAAGDGDPDLPRKIEERASLRRMMQWQQQRAANLETGHAHRSKWAEAHRDVAEDAQLAAEELARRNRAADRAGVVTPDPRKVGPDAAPGRGQEPSVRRPAPADHRDVEGRDVEGRSSGAARRAVPTTAEGIETLRTARQTSDERRAYQRGHDAAQDTARTQGAAAAAEAERQQRTAGYDHVRTQREAATVERGVEQDGPTIEM
ncbi:relaxase domain-containing protein [Pseudonocardia sp. ICBG1122]|nr:relaxase domain-containing protein [Pseudonocardia pini]NWJ69622.1 relaxase domain-containing protein [Pseudonocardia pini]